MRRYGDYKLGGKPKGGLGWKLLVAAVVALLFWTRYEYCHHPVINPDHPDTPPPNAEEPDDAPAP